MAIYKDSYDKLAMKESNLGKTYNDGDIICHEGDEGNNMFVVQSGTVEVTKKGPQGDVKLGTLTKGKIFWRDGII